MDQKQLSVVLFGRCWSLSEESCISCFYVKYFRILVSRLREEASTLALEQFRPRLSAEIELK